MMKSLPLNRLGARERKDQPGVIDFGILLPDITETDGDLIVRIIHERDQFLQEVPPVEVPLTHSTLDDLGDYWSGSVDTTDPATKPSTARGWGAQGGEQRYVYRYVLKRSGGLPEIDDIIDPFAREYGVGDLSAITVRYQPFEFDPAVEEQQFKVPAIRDAIVYELNIAELGGDLPKTIGLLDYIANLGINIIEVMPITNVAQRVDWGYAPLGYFGVDERYGKRRDFQQFVAEAHQRGIAIVLDGVFGHVEDRFPYARLYQRLGRQSPFIGPYAEDLFFKSTDFAQQLTQDFFFTVCVHWLEVYHVDGIRYDAVSQYWDEGRPVGEQGFVDLAKAVHAHVLTKAGATDHYQRFFPSGNNGEPTLIQIAEYLTSQPPEHVLYDTVANSAWQNQTMEAAKRCARGESGAITEFGLRLGLPNYPEAREQSGVMITKSALQYIESHDHERFICTYGTRFPDEEAAKRGDRLLLTGDRNGQWFKVQPYQIGVLMAKGTPFLWQGQEFCQNYFIPNEGIGRVAIFRPVDFNFFYDSIGKAMIRLMRKLTRIRQRGPQFRHGDHFFYNVPYYTFNGLLLFHRRLGDAFSLVALNFTDDDKTTTFDFPKSGNFTEEIEGTRNLNNVQANTATSITIPSNYGCVWTG
jgi:1,4-alpha-glucan branching enzyme